MKHGELGEKRRTKTNTTTNTTNTAATLEGGLSDWHKSKIHPEAWIGCAGFIAPTPGSRPLLDLHAPRRRCNRQLHRNLCFEPRRHDALSSRSAVPRFGE